MNIIDSSKYESKGFVGLTNLGNTCFLNSCLQVFNHTYEIHAVLDSKCKSNQIKHDSVESIILKEWNELRELMWSGNGTISPNKFVHNVHQIAKKKNRDIFTGWLQNDITEFLLFLVDCFHNSISRKITMKINGTPENKTDALAIACYTVLETIYSKEYSEIMDIFYGMYVTSISTMDQKKTHSLKPEHFFVLDLQIFKGDQICPTLYDCFDLFVTPEEMIGENAWFNEKTGKKEDIMKGASFWSFPKVLVITLKRFSPDGSQKINNVIQFPLMDLDLSKYVKGYHPDSYVYDLYGVCNHMGNVSGGHYTAFVKNVSGQWVHYNDNHVEIVQDPNIIISPTAYCLFYRKKNNSS
jgi:ubiquitin carboxyl-terminal hydrolase 8